ncbi:hypothetical protein ASE98_06670 [Pseudomonas sp. Leaf48]|nr:hypothetical protein ASE98_06670 [Pseudomonas sp. Leaf48]
MEVPGAADEQSELGPWSSSGVKLPSPFTNKQLQHKPFNMNPFATHLMLNTYLVAPFWTK